MNITMINAGMKYVTGLAATGPWGLAGIAVGALGLLAALAYGIGRLNKGADESDLNQGGTDAGVTAQTLKNQADLNREFLQQARDDFNKT